MNYASYFTALFKHSIVRRHNGHKLKRKREKVYGHFPFCDNYLFTLSDFCCFFVPQIKRCGIKATVGSSRKECETVAGEKWRGLKDPENLRRATILLLVLDTRFVLRQKSFGNVWATKNRLMVMMTTFACNFENALHPKMSRKIGSKLTFLEDPQSLAWRHDN